MMEIDHPCERVVGSPCQLFLPLKGPPWGIWEEGARVPERLLGLCSSRLHFPPHPFILSQVTSHLLRSQILNSTPLDHLQQNSPKDFYHLLTGVVWPNHNRSPLPQI